MNVTFLGQGLGQATDSPAGDWLNRSFADPAFTEFHGLVAFATDGGVARIEDNLKSFMKRTNDNAAFYIGVDHQGTSQEALQRLLAGGVPTYIFHNLSPSVIYHPKVYIFKGSRYRIFSGSSNFTGAGLYQNVEASMLVEFDHGDQAGLAVLRQIEDYFGGFLTGSDANLQRLTPEVLDLLGASGLIPREALARRSESLFYPGQGTPEEQQQAERQQEKLAGLFPKRDIPKAPKRPESRQQDGKQQDGAAQNSRPSAGAPAQTHGDNGNGSESGSPAQTPAANGGNSAQNMGERFVVHRKGGNEADRKSEFPNSMAVMKMYNRVPLLTGIVRPVMDVFTHPDQIKTKKEVNGEQNNRASHAEALGLLQSLSGHRCRLTPLGQQVFRERQYLDDIPAYGRLFGRQISRFALKEGSRYLFPYRAVMQILLACQHLSTLEFIYAVYPLKETSDRAIAQAIERIQYIRTRFPQHNPAMLGETQKINIMDHLNDTYGLSFSYAEIWKSGNTKTTNQFNYLKNHLTVFADWFEDRSDKSLVIRPDKEQEVSAWLKQTEDTEVLAEGHASDERMRQAYASPMQ